MSSRVEEDNWKAEAARVAARAAAVVLGVALGGCLGVIEPSPQPSVNTGPRPLETKYYASDEDVQAGARHFSEGAFGLAQEKFQAAAEKAPTDPVAWIGLAASYDRLRRFDLADRAYAQAEKLEPSNPALFNNRGYSYLLRGDVVKARVYFLRARALDPEGAAIANNLHLLAGSRKHVRRHAPAY